MREVVPRKPIRGVPLLALAAVVLTACVAPMRWEKPGITDAIAATDKAECHAVAHETAIRLFPYGNGPPFHGAYREMSMLQWTRMIDTARDQAEEDRVRACMRARGYSWTQMPPAR